MRKKLVVIFSLILMASACSTQAPAEVITPTQTKSVTATAAKTPIIVETPTSATSPPETPIPTNAPDCTNSASFVADVTIPDNSILTPGETFTKTWRIKNTGTCIWGPEYTLIHYSEERMLAPASVPLSVTFPGQTMDISMELVAPRESGKHCCYFVIENPAGLIMKIDNDSRLWVVIKITNEPASTQTSGSTPITGSGDNFAKVTCPYTTDTAKITETINAINAYRATNGLPAYTVNELLNMAASAHAADMACNNFFTHTGSDNSSPASRVAASKYSASSVTENVYGSYPPLTGQGAVDWWKNDKTDIHHNLNLLSTVYTEIGVGYTYYDNFGYYVVVFAKPK